MAFTDLRFPRDGPLATVLIEIIGCEGSTGDKEDITCRFACTSTVFLCVQLLLFGTELGFLDQRDGTCLSLSSSLYSSLFSAAFLYL